MVAPRDMVRLTRKAIEVLGDVGWSQGDFMQDDGSVCVLGAFYVANGATFKESEYRSMSGKAQMTPILSESGVSLGGMGGFFHRCVTAYTEGRYNHIPPMNDSPGMTVEKMIAFLEYVIEGIEQQIDPNMGVFHDAVARAYSPDSFIYDYFSKKADEYMAEPEKATPVAPESDPDDLPDTENPLYIPEEWPEPAHAALPVASLAQIANSRDIIDTELVPA